MAITDQQSTADDLRTVTIGCVARSCAPGRDVAMDAGRFVGRIDNRLVANDIVANSIVGKER